MSTNTSNPSNDNSQAPLLKQKLDLYHKDLKRGLELIIDQEALQVTYDDDNKKVLYVPVKSVHNLLDTFSEALDSDLLKPTMYSIEVLRDLASYLKGKLPKQSFVSNFLDPEWAVEIHKTHETIDAVLDDLTIPNETDVNNDVLKTFHKSHQMLLQTYVTQTKELDSLKERLAQTEKELELCKQVVDRAWASLKILKQ